MFVRLTTAALCLAFFVLLSILLTMGARAQAGDLIGFPTTEFRYTLRYGILDRHALGTFQDALGLLSDAPPRGFSLRKSTDHQRDLVIELTDTMQARNHLKTLVEPGEISTIESYTTLRNTGSVPRHYVVHVLWDRVAMRRLPNGTLVQRPDALARVTAVIAREVYGVLPWLMKQRLRPFAFGTRIEMRAQAHLSAAQTLSRIIKDPNFEIFRQHEMRFFIQQHRTEAEQALGYELELRDGRRNSDGAVVEPTGRFRILNLLERRCELLFAPSKAAL